MKRKFSVLIALIVAIAFLTSATPMLASSSDKKESTKKVSSSKSKKSDKKSEKKKEKKKKSSSSKSKSDKSTKKKSTTGKININKASKEELMQLTGIGEVKAEAIIKARKKGKFKSADDLQNVKGIGDETIKKIKRHIIF